MRRDWFNRYFIFVSKYKITHNIFFIVAICLLMKLCFVRLNLNSQYHNEKEKNIYTYSNRSRQFWISNVKIKIQLLFFFIIFFFIFIQICYKCKKKYPYFIYIGQQVKASMRVLTPKETKYIQKPTKFDIPLIYSNLIFIKKIFKVFQNGNESLKWVVYISLFTIVFNFQIHNYEYLSHIRTKQARLWNILW